MISRRGFLKFLGNAFWAGLAAGSWSIGVEPMLCRIRRYNLTPPRWPDGLKLSVACLADIHACEPWMTAGRIAGICDKANALEPDLILLLGDYASGMNLVTDYVHSRDWSASLARLQAPLGVHAVMGNHDWWEDKTAQRAGHGPTFGHRALADVGIPVYDNRAVRLEKDGHAFWLAGLADQLALLPGHGSGRRNIVGLQDLPATLEQVTDDAPVILMAHEPDIFPDVPDRVSLTLSGHTHGGQVNLFGWTPVVPSRFKSRYAYGHKIEEDRHIIISGGLGNSILPVRFGVFPEIVHLKLG